MIWLNQHKKAIILAATAAVFAAFIFILASEKNKEPVKQAVSTETKKPEVKQEAVKDESNETIVIDIKGAVKHPGVYEMRTGDRVSQAIEKAGGTSEQADDMQVNLAELLQDGTVVYIPKKGEESAVSQGTGGAVKSDGGKGSLVNINTATLEELQGISGVGPSKAEAIIAYREENGRFQTIEDITKVSGIGEKSFEKIKSSITVK
ncbi:MULTISPECIES: helix-hairpin-helix domain-containing protein [unclassified Bacillus (in: firmicutes)]|uniref:helix-hairpin-helix domain-containing protein n=1 Tax=unclassified Bacillus (in: firmicutes) TaxID=185979 RepID=UPI0022819ED7|nr:helix-hairpin-helix domain-containing protein [Bacillus sp. S20C3]MCY8205203.1 helix-hairpin-helix domain-containing protein [Bacillus sp. N12A5]MCY8289621.1 helix-hairpin-helix domain-containing protein [Bacillus sp. N13C7]MCY8638408.1 helix-hairpin-helix domain-containing protein [Bacillus sp. S17B2]MCY8719009.1 helix-hairpin-helix domain-containing protein [Bacillus sp. S10C12M]MCY9144125.1 helix-hairpin-helix domain-containing protein [Bacillus sp. T9C1]